MKTLLTALFNLRKMPKLHLLVMASAFFIICSCNNTKKEHSVEQSPDELPTNAVPVDSATAAIERYANYLITTFNLDAHDSLKTVFFSSTPRAFLIHRSDMIGVLGDYKSETAFPAARAYLGMTGSNQMHLYMTPTVQVINNTDTAFNDTLLSTASGVQYVYDLILPCPNTCDKNGSILDKAFTTPFN